MPKIPKGERMNKQETITQTEGVRHLQRKNANTPTLRNEEIATLKEQLYTATLKGDEEALRQLLPITPDAWSVVYDAIEGLLKC